MRLIDADALTDFLKCLLPGRGMWEIDGDAGKNAVCETVAEAIEMVKNMETIKPETNCSEFPNNSDTISRQAAIDVDKDELIKALKYDREQYKKGYAEGHANRDSEIIRCKDCKFYGRADKRRFYRGMDCLNSHIATIVPDMDFCSKAERRTDG